MVHGWIVGYFQVSCRFCCAKHNNNMGNILPMVVHRRPLHHFGSAASNIFKAVFHWRTVGRKNKFGNYHQSFKTGSCSLGVAQNKFYCTIVQTSGCLGICRGPSVLFSCLEQPQALWQNCSKPKTTGFKALLGQFTVFDGLGSHEKDVLKKWDQRVEKTDWRARQFYHACIFFCITKGVTLIPACCVKFSRPPPCNKLSCMTNILRIPTRPMPLCTLPSLPFNRMMKAVH